MHQHYNLITWNSSLAALKEDSIKVTDAFKAMDIEYLSLNYSLKEAFFANVPGNANAIKSDYRFIGTTDLAASLINIDSSYRQTGTGAGIIVCDKNIMDELYKKAGRPGYLLDPEKLIWTPFKLKYEI